MAKGTDSQRRSTSAVYGLRPSNARVMGSMATAKAAPDGRLTIRLDAAAEHLLCSDTEGALCGLFVVTDSALQAGTPLGLALEGPWGAPLAVRGKVAWAVATPRESLRQRPGMGVRLELTAAHRATLSKALVLRAPVPWPQGVP